MSYVTYSDKNLLRYATLKEIESDYQRFKEKALEIKPCLTRKAYRTLKNRSVKKSCPTYQKIFKQDQAYNLEGISRI